MNGKLTALLLALAIGVSADLALWGGHVAWRSHALRGLSPMIEQIDILEADIAADDTWIGRNERLSQGYGRHQDYAERIELRAQRARAHDVLVETYNTRVRRLYRRFYLAPRQAPSPPLREVLGNRP